LSEIKPAGHDSSKELSMLKRRLKRNMQTDKDWELFKQYFEEVNKDFFVNLKKINPGISPSEMKLAALIKLGFSIKETSSLLHLSEGSVRTGRYQLRKKLGLSRETNLYDYLNRI
jgi:DNA-binding CsgD family transcriptional regulator